MPEMTMFTPVNISQRGFGQHRSAMFTRVNTLGGMASNIPSGKDLMAQSPKNRPALSEGKAQ
jgi:hypothetical protein